MKEFHIKVYTWFLWLVAIFFITGIVFWFIPRDVIDLQIKTDKNIYKVGETIETTNTFTTYGYAESTYDSVLVCKNGIERRYNLFNIKSTSEPRPTAISKAEYEIPLFVESDHKCRLEITSAHTVQVLPLLEKTIHDKFESNEFSIKEV